MISGVEEQIRKAMQEGKFENLPGKGRPLHLEQNPFADPEWRLAYHVLRNAGYSLPWVETSRELKAEIERLRWELRRAWEGGDRQEARSRQAAKRRLRERFEERAGRLNRRILSFNLEMPLPNFHLALFKFEEELDRLAS